MQGSGTQQTAAPDRPGNWAHWKEAMAHPARASARHRARPQRHPPRQRRWRLLLAPLFFLWRLVLAFVKLTLLATLLLVAGGLWLYSTYARDLPDPRDIRQHHAAETTRIYAQDGETLLHELVDPQGGWRTVVPFERIPAMLKDATIAVEDAGFYDHPGVDVRGIIRALWLNARHQQIVSGGSTITQQLVRSILLPRNPSGEPLPIEQRYEHKLREAILAYRVNQEYSKDQILGLYLNEVYYGARAYGVEAAAQVYFGRHVWELSDGEATLLAGLPQSPARINPLVDFEAARARQQVTLDLMVKYGYLTPARAEAIWNEPITLASPATAIVAPHFVYYVRDLLEQRYGSETLYRGGLRVTTSLDLHWQAEAQRIALERIDELRPRNAHNAAVVMLAPDGRLLAMVGSIDYNNPVIDGEVNVALARRQPGSALKPIVYAAALQRGWTPATVIWDVPTRFMSGGVAYEPRNYDNGWHGPQRLRMALANSLNIPAVKALEFVGVEDFVQLAAQMGISTFDDPTRYGLSMALGSGEVRLLDLTAAYNTFRNRGYYRRPVAILKVTNNRGEVLERWQPETGRQTLGPRGEAIAYLITDMLSDTPARWYMFGRGNVMELPDGRPAAVKTGTSNDWRDSWAVGYTPDVTVGAWVGNNDNVPMEEIAGANGAGLIWRDVMVAYHTDRPPQPFAQPAQIVAQTICADTGGLVSDACPRPQTELFLAGSAPTQADVTHRTLRVGRLDDGSLCLAAGHTPRDTTRLETFAVYPPAFREWAVRNGIAQPPTVECPPPEPAEQAAAYLVHPGSPQAESPIYINGVARGPFRLEVAQGNEPDPDDWRLINAVSGGPIFGQGGSADQATDQAVGAGTFMLLGVWQTAGLAPGDYTLRLRVDLPDGTQAEASHLVTLARGQ